MTQRKLSAPIVTNEDKMINIYRSADAADQARLFSIFTEAEKRRINELRRQEEDAERWSLIEGLQNLKKAIEANLQVDSHVRHVAMLMHDELKECHDTLHTIPGTCMTEKQLKDTLYVTTALVQTSPDSPQFEQRASAFTQTMAEIRSEGRWDVVKGIGATLVTLMLLAGVALLAAATFGAFGAAFSLGMATLSAAGAGTGFCGAIYSSMFGFHYFCEAGEKLSFANKMQDLGEARGAIKLN